jgi:hypothetical protein
VTYDGAAVVIVDGLLLMKREERKEGEERKGKGYK